MPDTSGQEHTKKGGTFSISYARASFRQLRPAYRIAIIAGIVIAVLLAIGLMARSSTPGDMLYGLKVYVGEKLAGVTKVTDKQQFSYGVELLEKRIAELQHMSTNGELNAERLAEFDNQYEAQVQKINELLNSEDAPFDAREIFDTTNHMVAIVKASEQIMDHSTEEGASDRFEAVYDTAVAVHEAQLDRIASESTPEVMIGIIQEKLALITENLELQNQHTRLEVQEHLIDAGRAVATQDFRGGLESVGAAIQLLEVRSYVSVTQG